MNYAIRDMVRDLEPKIKTLSEEEEKNYTTGLLLLSLFTSENFLDIPPLPENKYEKDGYYYEIPYFTSEMLYSSGKARMILVVYQIENKASSCPFRFDVEVVDKENFGVWLYDQTGERTQRMLYISREKGNYYSQVTDYDKLTLSQLIESLCKK